MEFFTATERLKKFFLQLEIFDVCATHTRVWQEIEYRIDVCHVTRAAHRKSLVVKKNFSFPVAVKNSIKVGPLIFLL